MIKLKEITWETLPSWIQEEMLVEQEKQTGERDERVFKVYPTAFKKIGGFDWAKSIKEWRGWCNILNYGVIPLPEKIAVRVNPGDDIDDWFQSNVRRGIMVNEEAYLHLPEIQEGVICSSSYVEEGYIEVTPDEFRRWWMCTDKETVAPEEAGQKESSGKLHVEYDFEFLVEQLERMGKNKEKYEEGNWKKPINIEELKKSLFRHVLEVMQDKYEDDGAEYGHLAAIALNAMFIRHQLKLKECE